MFIGLYCGLNWADQNPRLKLPCTKSTSINPNRKLSGTSMIIELVTQVMWVTSLPGIFPLYLIVDGLFEDAISK